jgi:hypothetical protein
MITPVHGPCAVQKRTGGYCNGVAALVIPLAWLVLALLVRRSLVISDEVKVLVFGLGIAVLIALAGFVIYADVSPFLHMWPSFFHEASEPT